jgi:hypothetical protein
VVRPLAYIDSTITKAAADVVNGLEEILSGGRVISWLAVTGYPGGWPADLPGVFRAW